MPRVRFITHDGTAHELEVASGSSLMRAATDHGVPGIDGDCGGQAACATCHLFIEPPWAALSGTRSQIEDDMLNFTSGLRETSRLGCQVKMSAELDGIVVHLPEGQH